MIKLLTIAALAATTTMTTHITGNLATRDTYGAWLNQHIELPANTDTVIHIQALANGKNTFFDATLTAPGMKPYVCTKTQMCAVEVKAKDVPLPWHIDVALVNENDGPAMYDIAVESK